jgi:uncharacterized Zn-finger protein
MTVRVKRAALIVAASVEVTCPYCGEPQPNPNDGSHLWLPEEVRSAQGTRTCVSCDEPFYLHAQSRVSVAS